MENECLNILNNRMIANVVFSFQFQQYDSALHGFDVEVNGKIYKGKIKSKQKALEEYDDVCIIFYTIISSYKSYERN
jgi:hypothetical protein